MGVVELRYSPACGVTWGRFTPATVPVTLGKPGPWRIHVTAVRETTPARVEPFDTSYSGYPVYGNVLHSTTTCVHAEAYFSGPGWHSIADRTACYRGATGVHP